MIPDYNNPVYEGRSARIPMTGANRFRRFKSEDHPNAHPVLEGSTGNRMRLDGTRGYHSFDATCLRQIREPEKDSDLAPSLAWPSFASLTPRNSSRPDYDIDSSLDSFVIVDDDAFLPDSCPDTETDHITLTTPPSRKLSVLAGDRHARPSTTHQAEVAGSTIDAPPEQLEEFDPPEDGDVRHSYSSILTGSLGKNQGA